MDRATDGIQSLNLSDRGKDNQPELDAKTSSADDSCTENFEERGSNGRRPQDHWGNLEHDCPVCGTWRMFCPGCGSSAYAFPCY
jgi:hypothetical protein